MNYEIASALALEASEAEAYVEMTESDRSIIERFNSADLDFALDYFGSVLEYNGRRFIIGDDGDFYMIDGSTVFYVETESCVGFPDGEIPSAAL